MLGAPAKSDSAYVACAHAESNWFLHEQTGIGKAAEKRWFGSAISQGVSA
jgi:hypothetical protein